MASAWGGSWLTSWALSWSKAAAVSVVDTHDGGPRRRYSHNEVDELRKWIARSDRARDQSIAEKRKAEEGLRETILRAFRQASGEPEIVPAEIIAEARLPTVPTDGIEPPQPDWQALATDIAALKRLVTAFEAQIQIEARDEEDVEFLLLAL